LLGAEFAALCTAVLMGVVVGFSRGLARSHGGVGGYPNPLIYVLTSTIVLQGTLLFADLRQGRLYGHGDLAVGLGAGPMRRYRLVALIAGAAIVWIVVLAAILVHVHTVSAYVSTRVPAVLTLSASASPVLLAIQVLLIVLFAPVAEELFFRGWLWTALRKTWGVWPTAVCTACLWLAVHLLDAPIRALVLLPPAVLLSLARHYGNSARASLVVHVVNNAFAASIQLAALLLARH
jgi:membrane protease YdiL (CAAX protease family)